MYNIDDFDGNNADAVDDADILSCHCRHLHDDIVLTVTVGASAIGILGL